MAIRQRGRRNKVDFVRGFVAGEGKRAGVVIIFFRDSLVLAYSLSPRFPHAKIEGYVTIRRIMEIERINTLSNTLIDLATRAASLRGYL